MSDFFTALATISQRYMQGKLDVEQAGREMQRQAALDALNVAQVRSQLETSDLYRRLAQAQEGRATAGFETPAARRAAELAQAGALQTQTFETGAELTAPGRQELLGLQAEQALPFLGEAMTGIPEQPLAGFAPFGKLTEPLMPKAPVPTGEPPAWNVPLELPRPIERPPEVAPKWMRPEALTEPLDILKTTAPLTGVQWGQDPFGRPIISGDIPTREQYEGERAERGYQERLRAQGLTAGELRIQQAGQQIAEFNVRWPGMLADVEDEGLKRDLERKKLALDEYLTGIELDLYESYPDLARSQKVLAAQSEIAIMEREAATGLPREKFPSTVISEYGPTIAGTKEYEAYMGAEPARLYTAGQQTGGPSRTQTEAWEDALKLIGGSQGFIQKILGKTTVPYKFSTLLKLLAPMRKRAGSYYENEPTLLDLLGRAAVELQNNNPEWLKDVPEWQEWAKARIRGENPPMPSLPGVAVGGAAPLPQRARQPEGPPGY